MNYPTSPTDPLWSRRLAQLSCRLFSTACSIPVTSLSITPELLTNISESGSDHQESTSGLDIDQYPGSSTNREHHLNFSRDGTMYVQHGPHPGDLEKPEPLNRLPNLSKNTIQVQNPRLSVNWQSLTPPADSTYPSQPPEEQQNAKPVAVGFSLREPTNSPPTEGPYKSPIKSTTTVSEGESTMPIPSDVVHPTESSPTAKPSCTPWSTPHNLHATITEEAVVYLDRPRAFDLNKALTDSRITIDKLSNNIITLTNTICEHSKITITTIYHKASWHTNC